jgi:hypothetical protein
MEEEEEEESWPGGQNAREQPCNCLGEGEDVHILF